MREGPERPGSIGILAALASIGGTVAIQAALGESGVLALVIGGAQLAFGVGALLVRPWAWTLGVVLQVVSAVVTLVAMLGDGLTRGNGVSLLVSLAILFYLYQPDIRRAFGRLAAPTNVEL